MADKKIKAVFTQKVSSSKEQEGRVDTEFLLKCTEEKGNKTQNFMDCALTYYNVPQEGNTDLMDAVAVMMQELSAEGIMATDMHPGGLAFDLTQEQFLIFEKEVIELFGELNDYGAEGAEKNGVNVDKFKAKKAKAKKPKLRKR